MENLLDYWHLFALAMLVANTSILLVNQHFKSVNGNLLVFWRGVIPAIVLAPIVLQMDWPTSPWFYIATLATSFICTYTDTVKFKAPRRFGAAVYSCLAPIAVWVAFIGWFIFSADYRQYVYANPLSSAMVFTAVAVGFWAVLRMKERCKTSWNALGYIGPAVLLAGVVALLNKTAMSESGLWQGVLIYAFIQALTIPMVKVVSNMRHGVQFKEYFTPEVAKVGLIIGLLFICLNVSKNLAITGSPNPAYVMLIGFSQPLVIMVLNFFLKKEDKTDKISGMALVASVVLLILGTRVV